MLLSGMSTCVESSATLIVTLCYFRKQFLKLKVILTIIYLKQIISLKHSLEHDYAAA